MLGLDMCFHVRHFSRSKVALQTEPLSSIVPPSRTEPRMFPIDMLLTILTKPAGPNLYILFCCCNWNWKNKDIKAEIKQDPPECDSLTISLWTIKPELYRIIKGNLVDEKHRLLRCWRVYNGHKSCPGRSCFSDSSPSSTAAPSPWASPPSPGWSSFPGSWARRGRSCHQHQVQLCQWLHFCKRCAIVCNSIDGGRAAHWKIEMIN